MAPQIRCNANRATHSQVQQHATQRWPFRTSTMSIRKLEDYTLCVVVAQRISVVEKKRDRRDRVGTSPRLLVFLTDCIYSQHRRSKRYIGQRPKTNYSLRYSGPRQNDGLVCSSIVQNFGEDLRLMARALRRIPSFLVWRTGHEFRSRSKRAVAWISAKSHLEEIFV